MSYLAVNSFDDNETVKEIGMRVEAGTVIKAIRFNMLKHGTIADGTLTLDILNVDDVIIGTQVITNIQFNSLGGTYAHGMIAFIFDNQIAINKDDDSAYIQLKLRLTMASHTEDINNFVALVREFDRPIVEEYGTRPTSEGADQDGWFNPYGVEVYAFKK